MKKLILIATVVSLLSACSSDPRSMWNSRYAWKTAGEVQAMCDDGDRDACYAAIDLRGLTNGLNAANGSYQAVQVQQQPVQQPVVQAPTMQTTNCRPVGNMVQCTTF